MHDQLQSIVNFYSANIQALTSSDFYALNKQILRLARKASGMDNIEVTGFTPEKFFLEQYLPLIPDATVVDVGAYRGDYSICAKAANPSATVYAFEPHPATYKRLTPVARQHGFIAMNMACSDKAGTIELFDVANADRSFRTTAYQDAIEDMLNAESVAVEAMTVTLDEFCSSAGIERIDLLKIDAEGHEIAILDGARGMLGSQSIDAIQFEFNELNVFSRHFFRDFVEALPDYHFFLMLPDGQISLGEYNPLEHENFVYQNIIAFARWNSLVR